MLVILIRQIFSLIGCQLRILPLLLLGELDDQSLNLSSCLMSKLLKEGLLIDVLLSFGNVCHFLVVVEAGLDFTLAYWTKAVGKTS